jgi:hypothetical protein
LRWPGGPAAAAVEAVEDNDGRMTACDDEIGWRIIRANIYGRSPLGRAKFSNDKSAHKIKRLFALLEWF